MYITKVVYFEEHKPYFFLVRKFDNGLCRGFKDKYDLGKFIAKRMYDRGTYNAIYENIVMMVNLANKILEKGYFRWFGGYFKVRESTRYEEKLLRFYQKKIEIGLIKGVDLSLRRAIRLYGNFKNLTEKEY